MATVALLNRLPALRWRPQQNQQIVAPADQARYPLLAEDFTFLEREIMPHFRQLDNEALRRQNQFRLEQLALIFGGALASALGAFHFAFADAAWLGVPRPPWRCSWWRSPSGLNGSKPRRPT